MISNYLRAPLVDATAEIASDIKVFGDGARVRVGAYSRIDAHCIITVGEHDITIGDHVHISAGVYIFGSSGKVTIGNGCFLSPRSIIYTATDTVRDCCLVGPTFDKEDRNVIEGPVTLQDCSGVFTGGIVMPNVVLGYASVVGYYSLCNRSLKNGEVMVNMDIIYTRDWEKILEKYRAKNY